MEGEEPGVFGYKRHRLGWGNQDGLKISKGWLSPLVATGGILRPTSGKSPRGTGWKEGRAAPYRLEVGQSLTSSSVPWLGAACVGLQRMIVFAFCHSVQCTLHLNSLAMQGVKTQGSTINPAAAWDMVGCRHE